VKVIIFPVSLIDIPLPSTIPVLNLISYVLSEFNRRLFSVDKMIDTAWNPGDMLDTGFGDISCLDVVDDCVVKCL
jgi:hypothetical protein